LIAILLIDIIDDIRQIDYFAILFSTLILPLFDFAGQRRDAARRSAAMFTATRQRGALPLLVTLRRARCAIRDERRAAAFRAARCAPCRSVY